MASVAAARFYDSPWAACAGLFVGAPAVAVNQQLAANLLYWSCRSGFPLTGLVLGLVTGALTLSAGLLSWRARAYAEQAEVPGARKFLGEVGAASAAVFLLAIIAQTLASLIVPECHR